MKTETKLIKPLLQVVVVSLALFLGLSRIAENAHFLSDVVAGFVLGAIIAWLMVSFPLQITRNQDILEPWHIKLSETPFSRLSSVTLLTFCLSLSFNSLSVFPSSFYVCLACHFVCLSLSIADGIYVWSLSQPYRQAISHQSLAPFARLYL